MAKKAKPAKSDEKPRAKAEPVKVMDGYGGVVVFEFIGNEGEHIVGIPARDLTLEDYDRLEGSYKDKFGPKWDVQASADSPYPLYKRLIKVGDARKHQAKLEADAEKASIKAEKSIKAQPEEKDTQADPDPRTPGRIDSDVIAAGVAVPQTDEPLAEGAPGFMQSDTGGPQAPG